MFDVLSSVYSDLLKRFGWRKELEKEWKAIGDVEGGRGGGDTVHLTFLSASSVHKRLNDSPFVKIPLTAIQAYF